MILLVPIHLDALSLKTDQPVLDAKADFTRLPYTDGTRDINGDVAYISEEIVSEPFQDQGLYLKAGIHLHWALPDALTKGVQTSTGTNFPDVPNRWLVIRKGQDSSKKQWVIESDYLYPNGEGENSGSISFPVMPPPSSGCPFRFLGRNVSLETWKPNDAQAEYLNSLTAVGYGEPTFAAFYPNCFSVFGFHDADYTSIVPDKLQYDVIGWYSDKNKDCLKKILSSPINKAKSRDELVELIEKEFKWTLSINDAQEFPSQTLYYARLIFNPNANSARNTSVNISSPDITVANTGTEALSAYLANVLADDARQNNDDKSVLKSRIEDQLEALSFSARLSNRQLDVGPKFQEARHEKGFSTVSGGTIWSITPRSKNAAPADSSQANLQQQITLPNDMAHRLNNVNSLQQDYDRALEEIESRRRQLFSDWYKYLLCAYPLDDAGDSYPNIDEVMDFIELEGLAPLKKKSDATGELKLQTDADGNIVGATSTSSSSLALQLTDALNKLFDAVSEFNNKESTKKANIAYYLKQVSGPRYYQPNDPVVLLTGDAVMPPLRHGQDGRLRDDGLLECQLLSIANNQNLIPENIAAITARIDEIKNQSDENIAFGVWTEQPWNPFLMEWEAEVFPVESGSNLESETGNYQPDFINRNFTLKEDDVDFSVRERRGTATKAANVYTGSSILTPYAGIQLTTQIEAYLKEQLLQDYYTAKRISQDERGDDYFSKNAGAILDWYKTDNCKAGDNSALCNIIRAYEKLTEADFHTLSQSLGGFNEALLMHKQTMQLDIADPLAFDDYLPFADAVKSAVEESVISAPQPLNDFNPIRSGALKLLRLRLVDTFGQVLDINCENDVITTEQLKVDGSPYEMTLPTRLTQPARIDFSWLSAVGDDVEMNDHPATSPICGWLLPNNLDRSLMVYDSAGDALGSIDQMVKWEASPGSDSPIDADKIANPHLKKVVKYLLAEGKDFLQDFISALGNALENIEPENFAQHQDIALLMGSPIAVVRASVNLELRGLPAIHQGWNVFRQDLKRDKRETDDFDKVVFPIRIGEYKQFNDGVVGYWKESDGDYEGSIFYAPQSNEITNPHIKTHHDDAMTIYQTVVGPTQFLTMLVDPRGSVHVTSGILPVKAINIPPDQYTDALKAIEITFLSTPILTEVNRLRLPLPDEPGFRWSWLQKDKYNWTEITTPGIVRKQTFLDVFTDNGEAIWNALVESAWIAPRDNGTSAVIVPKDKRGKTKLDDDLASQSAEIEDLLEQAQISGITNSVFPNTQRILEGWLKLSNS